MIHPDCFTFDWLQAKRREIRAGDPALLERALHALALLGHLAESGLDFVFKGGTSLLLHVPVIRRLSIDIDILCGAPPEELIRALDEVSKVSPFIRYQEDSRGARGLPNRRHFRFFYNPLLPGNPSPYVFLDVVEEHDVPHDVIEKSIAPQILDIRREVFVKVPTIESLLADKLCAFAPRTIGVPFEPENGHAADSMQIVKQLFDVGELFSLAEDLPAVRRVYQRVFDQENVYRGGHLSQGDALQDTLDVSLNLCLPPMGGPELSPVATMLLDGVRKLMSHLVNHRFNLDDAKLAAAKAGLLTRLIAKGDSGESLDSWRRMPGMDSLRDLLIDGEWNRLNRLKAVNPEAFYYWYQGSRL